MQITLNFILDPFQYYSHFHIHVSEVIFYHQFPTKFCVCYRQVIRGTLHNLVYFLGISYNTERNFGSSTVEDFFVSWYNHLAFSKFLYLSLSTKQDMKELYKTPTLPLKDEVNLCRIA